ncbi:MAG: 23S rRNA (uracil(1939)-C(5))-methyltransferase RlmD [Candidatus Eremiobacteraeota bacterium]|nr:23S rRNA (uracil(1939)-C(5))-methyltransferase RlmD [Candidatus Eremiobacteraeota bacterium]
MREEQTSSRGRKERPLNAGGAPFREGERITIQLGSIASGGDAVGRNGDFVFFVPYGVPGDIVTIQVTEKRKSYARGEIALVERPSRDRVEPPCPHFFQCGGCQFQHISYEAQRAIKKNLVIEALERIGRLSPVNVRDLEEGTAIWHYRNKVQCVVGGSPAKKDEKGEFRLGLYARKSHRVVDLGECLIQHPLNNKVLASVRDLLPHTGWTWYREDRHCGHIRHVMSRASQWSNEVVVTLVASKVSLAGIDAFAGKLLKRVPEIRGVVLNVNSSRTNVILGREQHVIAGSETLVEKVKDLEFSISPLSFFQVNIQGLVDILEVVERYACLEGNERVLDLFCGVGLFSLALARKAREVHGVDEVGEAIENAIENARRNGIENVRFTAGKAEETVRGLMSGGADLVILDPPRSGARREVLEALADPGVPRIVYVSCNPATLARDLGLLCGKGYRLVEVQPLDMFPHTGQVEAVAYLEKSCRY